MDACFTACFHEAMEFSSRQVHHPRGGGRQTFCIGCSGHVSQCDSPQIGDMLFIIERGVCDACKLLADHEVRNHHVQVCRVCV